MALKEKYEDQVAFIVADLDDPDTEKFLALYTVRFIPVIYFINRQGETVAEKVGALRLEEAEQLLDKLVADAPAVEDVSWLERFFADVIPDVVASRSLLTLIVVFFGGLVTSISPCILTMVPLLVSYIGGYGEGPRSRGFIMSFIFVVGMAVTFALLGFIAAYFGRIFGEIGQIWYYILAAVAIVMGLQLLGLITFNLPGLKKIPIRKPGLGGSMLMGLLFGLVASPCATPVLAVIITYAAVQAEPFYGSALLFIYGLGHGIPLLLAGTFTGLAKNLPKINRYTSYLSYASGVLLIILGIILLAWVNWM